MSRLTVVRVPRDQRAGFTVVSNDVVRPSGRLSIGALGILTHLLSHAEGWDVSAERLTREFAGATLHAVKKLLRELEAAGHLERSRVNTASGFDHRWVVHEQPIGCHAIDGQPIDGPTTVGTAPGIKKTTDKKTTSNGSIGSEADSDSLRSSASTLPRRRPIDDGVDPDSDDPEERLDAVKWYLRHRRGLHLGDVDAHLADRLVEAGSMHPKAIANKLAADIQVTLTRPATVRTGRVSEPRRAAQ